MSTTIQAKIFVALKAIDQLSTAKDLELVVDPQQPLLEQAAETDARLALVQMEVQRGRMYIDDIRKARDEWTDLLRKMNQPEREAENDKSLKFEQTQKVSEKMDAALVKLQELETLCSVLQALARIRNKRAEKEERDEIERAAAAMAATRPLQTRAAATGPTGQTLPFQLPAITVQKFAGDRRKWPEFLENFRSAVDSKLSSRADKMTMLRMMVEGEPYRLIAGLALNDANYDIAFDLLKSEYGDKTHYLRTLHAELSNLKTCHSLAQTKDFLLDLERVSRELQAAGEDIEGPQTFLTLEKKLPWKFLQFILDEKAKDPTRWTTTQFRETLSKAVKQEADRQEIFAEFHQGRRSSDGRPTQPNRNQGRGPRPLDRTFASAEPDPKPKARDPKATNRANQKRPTPKPAPPARGANAVPLRQIGQRVPERPPPQPCIFCGQPHWNANCTRFPSAQQRSAEARKLELCTRCLRRGHPPRNCPRPAICFHCKTQHPTALCTRSEMRRTYVAVSERSENVGETPPRQEQVSLAQAQGGNSKALLMTVQTTAFNPSDQKWSMTANIFVDPGSQRSYITEDAAKRLRLTEMGSENLKLCSFGDREPKRYTSQRVKLGLLGEAGDRYVFTLNMMKFIVGKMPIVDLQQTDESELQQRAIDPIRSMKQPDILLGVDVFFDLQIRPLQKLPCGFTLCSSRFGRILGGEGRLEEREHTEVVFTAGAFDLDDVDDHESRDNELTDKLSKFFGLQSVGMADATESNEEDEAMRQFRANLTFVEGRYEVGLPWNSNSHHLPTNFKLAKARLRNTLRKLRENPEALEQYQQKLDDQLEQGIIERVDDPKQIGGPVHYLPHRAVLRADKPGKVRIVYDASAKPRGDPMVPSLNDCLHAGPKLLNDLTGILLRFRTMDKVLLADLEMAFLKLAIRRQDRDACRFLWVERPNDVDLAEFNTTKCIVLRFTRVCFGLNCSPFLLNATVREHLSLFETNVARQIEANLYVDNILVEIKRENEIRECAEEMQRIFTAGGMKVREFITNVKGGLRDLPEEDKAPDNDERKILGIHWQLSREVIRTRLTPLIDEKLTKRKMLSTVASVFDPMGLVSPALLPAKLLLQRVWNLEAKTSWDETVTEDIECEWHKLMRDWQNEGEPDAIEIPRVLKRNASSELHCFADASGDGFGVAVYLRTARRANDIISDLLFSKSMVKPAKLKESEATIPRLELQAVAVGVKIVKFLQKEMDFNNEVVCLWTDSHITVDRLRREKKFDRYVMNRVTRIRGLFPVKHVKTTDNPADLTSRGMSVRELNQSTFWRHGPAWLSKPKDDWPKPLIEYDPNSELMVSDDESLPESVEEERPNTIAAAITATTKSVVQIDRFSNWKRLTRTIAYAFRFLRKATKGYNPTTEILKSITEQQLVHETPGAEELRLAEHYLIGTAQIDHPPDENSKRNLRLFKQDGLWRSRGRLQWSDQEEETKFPLFLPANSEITTLIVHHLHRANHHAGTGILLAIVRERFWIPEGRRTIRRIIQKCGTCRKFRLKPYRAPEAPLPESRLRQGRPFGITGVDLFGPLRIKTKAETEKVWTALFTCLKIRAIQLLLVEDLSAEAFLRSYRKFVARNGAPDLVMSDNATNFQLASQLIKERWSAHLAHQGTKWRMITPKAPWRGGTWERLIGVTKQCLKRTVGRSLLSRDELETLLCEIEVVVNSRPLTYQTDKDDEPLRSIRPIDFIRPYAIEANMPSMYSGDDPTDPDYAPKAEGRTKLVQMLQKAEKRLDQFWSLWISDYLPSLRERDRVAAMDEGRNTPKEGDVVLIGEEDTARSQWTMGRIVELIKGRDGIDRTATLDMGSGRKLTRAVNLLYPLEFSPEPAEQDEITAAAFYQTFEEIETKMSENPILQLAVTVESSLPPKVTADPARQKNLPVYGCAEPPSKRTEQAKSSVFTSKHAARTEKGCETPPKGVSQRDKQPEKGHEKWKWGLTPATYRIKRKLVNKPGRKELLQRGKFRRQAPITIADGQYRLILNEMGGKKTIENYQKWKQLPLKERVGEKGTSKLRERKRIGKKLEKDAAKVKDTVKKASFAEWLKSMGVNVRPRTAKFVTTTVWKKVGRPEMARKYLDSKPPTDVQCDYTLFTAEQKGIALRDIATKAKMPLQHSACETASAHTLIQCLLLHWLLRQQNKGKSIFAKLAEIVCPSDGSLRKTGRVYEELCIQQPQIAFDNKHINVVLNIWAEHSERFAATLNGYGPMRLGRTESPFRAYGLWLNTMLDRVNRQATLLKKENYDPSAHMLRDETVCVGDATANHLATALGGKKDFTYEPGDPGQKDFFPGERTKIVFFCYRLTEKDLADRLKGKLQALQHEAKIRADVILHPPFKDRALWAEAKDRMYEVCKATNTGLITLEGKAGETRKLAKWLNLQLAETVDSNVASTSKSSATRRTIAAISSLALLLLFLITCICLPESVDGRPIWQPLGMPDPWAQQQQHLIMQKRGRPETHPPPTTTSTVTRRPQQRVTKGRRRYYVTARPSTHPTLAQSLATSRPKGQKPAPTSTMFTTRRWETTEKATQITTQYRRQEFEGETSKGTMSVRRLTRAQQTATSVPQLTMRGFKPQTTPPGRPTLWCSFRAGTIWSYKGPERSPFCRKPRTPNAKWQRIMLPLYTRIRKPKELTGAFQCSIKKTEERYYTNIVGDHFLRTSKEMLHMTMHDCEKMTQEKSCPYGKLKKMPDGTWTTDNAHNVRFPGNFIGLFKGEQVDVQLNCFVQPAQIFLMPHNLQMLSPVHSLGHCRYQTGSCELEDNSTIVWDPSLCHGVGCRGCDFEPSAKQEGELSPPDEKNTVIFIGRDKEMALTFEDNAANAVACDGTELKLADQGIGTPKDYYHVMRLRPRNAHRQRRSVEEDQIAAELTAEEMAVTRSLKQLFQRECNRLRHTASPTFLARQLLNTTNIAARYIGENTMEIFNCAEVSLSTLAYRQSARCFKYIPVTVQFQQNARDAFLDPITRVLSSTAPFADCLNYRTHYLELSENNFIKIDTRTGNYERVQPNSITNLYDIGLEQAATTNLRPIFFHDWSIHNSTLTFVHFEELARIDHWKDAEKQATAERATSISATPQGLEGTIKTYLLEKLAKLLHTWMIAACLYSSFLCLRDLLAPIVIANLINPIITSVRQLIGGGRAPTAQLELRLEREEDGQEMATLPTPTLHTTRTPIRPILRRSRSTVTLNTERGRASFHRADTDDETERSPFV